MRAIAKTQSQESDDVLGQDKYRQAGLVAAESNGGTQSFVAEARRHGDVRDDRLGLVLVDGGDQRLGSLTARTWCPAWVRMWVSPSRSRAESSAITRRMAAPRDARSARPWGWSSDASVEDGGPVAETGQAAASLGVCTADAVVPDLDHRDVVAAVSGYPGTGAWLCLVMLVTASPMMNQAAASTGSGGCSGRSILTSTGIGCGRRVRLRRGRDPGR